MVYMYLFTFQLSPKLVLGFDLRPMQLSLPPDPVATETV